MLGISPPENWRNSSRDQRGGFLSWLLWILPFIELPDYMWASSECTMLICSGLFFVISGPAFLTLSRCICLQLPLNGQFLLEALPWKPSFLPVLPRRILAANFLCYPEMAVWPPSPVALGTDWLLSQPQSSAALAFCSVLVGRVTSLSSQVWSK